MTAIRLFQGVGFGFVFSSSDDVAADGSSGTGPVVSGVLLVLAVALYTTAIKQILYDEDPDAPPPKWMTMTASMGMGRGFLFGVGVLAIGAKFWVFTLGAAGDVSDADLSRGAGIGALILFVVPAESIHLAIVGAAAIAPDAAAGVLDDASDCLRRYTRVIMIVLGLVFGTWFLADALHGSASSDGNRRNGSASIPPTSASPMAVRR